MKKPFRTQRHAPICEGIQQFHKAKLTTFTAPGHKAGRGVDGDLAKIISRDAYRYDVSMMNGVDDRTESKDIQGQAEDLAASLYGSDASFFSTNGSSLSVHVALCVIGRPGDEIVIARNSHKSLAAGLIISGQKPVFVYPEYDDELDLVHSLDPDNLDATLKKHRKAKGVVVVNPDYYGFAGDVRKLAKVTHAHDLPLVVDEAWGVHFPFNRRFPEDALRAGADFVFGSFHKVLASIQQASIIHIQGRRIARDRRTVTGYDRSKIVIEVGDLGITGFEASDWLFQNEKIAMELADYRRILGLISLADSDATGRRLVRGIKALAKWAAQRRKKTKTDQLPRLSELKTKLAMTPRDAFFADAELVPIERAVGRIAAEMASPYPPGIPVIMPGEVVTDAIVQYLREGKRLGMLIPDVTDEKLKKLRVVKR